MNSKIFLACLALLQLAAAQEPATTRAMVVGGHNSDNFDTVEVLDLTPEAVPCGERAPYPVDLRFAVGTYHAGMATVCGGSVGTDDEDGATNACWQYQLGDDPGSDSWTEAPFTLTLARQEHAGSSIGPDTWIVTGGRNGAGEQDSVERIDGSEVNLISSLPQPMSGHCQLTIDNSTVLVAGEGPADGDFNAVYILDVVSGVWSKRTNVPGDGGDGAEYPACGLANGGQDLVVVHKGRVDVYNFADDAWREGNPVDITDYAAYVQDGAETFFMIGGYTNSNAEETDAVWRWDPAGSAFQELNVTLVEAKRSATAFAIPPELSGC